MSSLANTFEPSMRAAAREGPNTFRPASQNASVIPPISGDSGPTTVRSTPLSAAKSLSETRSSTGISTVSAMREMPGLPGAAYIAGSSGLAARVSTSACSRPPLPTTITFKRSAPRCLDPYPLHDRLVALGPDADHAQRCPDLGLDEPHKVARGFGEIPPHPAPRDVLAPPWQRLVDGPGVMQVRRVHGITLHGLVVDLVADADVYLLDRGEHVEQRDGHVRDAVERGGPFHRGQIEPPYPPRPSRGRAVLPPDAPYSVPRIVEELRGHRPVADARRVSLGNADHVLQLPRGDAGAHDRPPDGRVGRRNEGIGAVVVVQERRLAPFEQHTLPIFQRLPQEGTRVGDHRLDEILEGEQPGGHLRDVVVVFAVNVLEDGVLLPEGRLELGLQNALVEDVLDPYAGAGDLVLVGGAYAPVRRPYPGVAQGDLTVRVERDVVGHDEVRPTVHLETIPDLEAPGLQRLDLLDQHLGVDHDPVADGANHAFAHDARRHEVQLELLLADPDGVARVIAARVTRDVPDVGRQRVANPALALISPGQPEHDRGRQSSTSAAIWIVPEQARRSGKRSSLHRREKLIVRRSGPPLSAT